MTGYQLLEEYLLTKIGKEFTQLQIQRELDDFQRDYGKAFLPESLSRYFRFVRDDERMKKHGLEIIEVPERKHLTFKVIEIKELVLEF